MATFHEGNLVRCTATDLPAPLHRGQLYKVIMVAKKNGKVRLNTTFPPGFHLPVWADPDKVKMELVSESTTLGAPEATESPVTHEAPQAAQPQPRAKEIASEATTAPQKAILQGAEVYMVTADVNDRILVKLYADENVAADRAEDLALVFAKLNLEVGTRMLPMEVK